MKRLFITLLAVFVMMSCFCVSASAEETYVSDYYGLLSASEQQVLEDMARDVSERYGCAVYLMTIDDYRRLNGSYDIFEAAYTFYHDNSLGMGSGRDGVFLLISFNARDYSLFVYGDKAEYALNDYGQTMLEQSFLDDLSYNDWFSGFEDYINCCGELFALAQAGTPARKSLMPALLICIAVSALISLIVTGIMWGRNKNVRLKNEASGYVSGGLELYRREDRFVTRTVSRRRIQQQSGGGGGGMSRSGGGGSGRSGKF